jgi:hypothetical protein
VYDHLKCYKVKDPVVLSGVVDLSACQYPLEAGCKISKTVQYCVPANKVVIDAIDKRTGLPISPLDVSGPSPGDKICYKIKCAPPRPADATVTDQFGTRTLQKLTAQMLCVPAVRGTPGPATPTPTPTAPTPTPTPPFFVDHGDGTVSDVRTGLRWEKKTGTVGSLVDCAVSPTVCAADPHDVNNAYHWCAGTFPSCSNSANPSDGDAFTVFLSTLNGAAFAGFSDWRLPTIDELQSLIDLAFCGGGACIDPILGPTDGANSYWSSTTDTVSSNAANVVRFDTPLVGGGTKANRAHVRAVRGGPCP